MDDLWEIASGDHERFSREAALARAEAELESVMPFLLAARSEQEFAHRVAYAAEAFELIAARTGTDPAELAAPAKRQYELCREALAEGTDPLVALEPLLNGGGSGSGPEKPLEHHEGPDFSDGYSEIPMGNLTGPDPAVTRPRPEVAAPVTQPVASRRQAASSPGSGTTMQYTPPDLGTGPGSLDIGVPSAQTGGQVPSIPAGEAASQRTARRDPVHARVRQVTAMIARANPGLPRAECERLGRRVVSNYLRQADLTDSVMGNGPMNDSGGAGQSSGGTSHPVQHALEWQGARSLMGGGGGAAGAAEGASAAGELAELAPLLAL
jgi:hypothetical protein